MENRPRYHPKKRRNRHHILYPRQAWVEAGPIGTRLRGAFIVRMDSNLHSNLHYEIDPLIGDEVKREMLPSKRTLRHLRKEYLRNESNIRRMPALEKILWLNNHLDPERASNGWLRELLLYERLFLENHREEG